MHTQQGGEWRQLTERYRGRERKAPDHQQARGHRGTPQVTALTPAQRFRETDESPPHVGMSLERALKVSGGSPPRPRLCWQPAVLLPGDAAHLAVPLSAASAGLHQVTPCHSGHQPQSWRCLWMDVSFWWLSAQALDQLCFRARLKAAVRASGHPGDCRGCPDAQVSAADASGPVSG